MRDVVIATTAASYSGNKGAAAMLQSSISQLRGIYGHRLSVNLMSVYPSEDRRQLPFDFINVVSCKPEMLMAVAFPLAILYRVFRWCPPIRNLLCKQKILKTYSRTDLVIDEAGISFVDSRGFLMNTYAFICMAVPLLMGVPVVKYAQAMGPFHSFWNRFLAKWVLPKLKLICARGEQTRENLASIGITRNVRLCADGAFTMPDSPAHDHKVEEVCQKDIAFWNDRVVGLSISSVVQEKCTRMGICYPQIMADFTNWLTQKGYHVFLLANAARMNSQKLRNNDLPVGDEIYSLIADKTNVRWNRAEMDAEEIRGYIGKCRYLVASRFHAMVGSLERQVPVLLVGWSHKYQEVLDMFGLGQYAIDFSQLDLETLKKSFNSFVESEPKIRGSIAAHYDTVINSSLDNVRLIRAEIDRALAKPLPKGMRDLNHSDAYLGEHITCRMGYATQEEIRDSASSGGMVTALLCHWLSTGQIDGAFVSRGEIVDGRLSHRSWIATTPEEVRSASSSIYVHMGLLKHLNQIREFPGKVAVVMTPCLTEALDGILQRDEGLRQKIVLNLSLYCCSNHTQGATLLPLQKQGIDLTGATRLFYKRGHWRGQSVVLYQDGSEKRFSYTKTFCAYKNAFFFAMNKCMLCQDHFGRAADISFGDIWLKEMRSNPIKHTCCVIRTPKAWEMYQSAVQAGVLTDRHMTDRQVVMSQKRALTFKYNCAAAKQKWIGAYGGKKELDLRDRCRWNHRLAFALARHNQALAAKSPEKLAAIPTKLIFWEMCLIRALLSF